MKTPITLTTLCLLLAFSLSSCKQSSRNDYSNSELPIIDLEKEYPAKRIDIHEIADVEYIPLETTDESLLTSAGEKAVSENQIIVGDYAPDNHQILIFDRKGKYIKTINRRGQGPGEYLYFQHFEVDFKAEELYIYSMGTFNKIMVYSLDGEFLRSFAYPNVKDKNCLRFESIYNYNDDYLLAYNEKYWPSSYEGYYRDADKTPYYLINKQNGKATPADKRLTLENPVPCYLDKMGPDYYGNPTMPLGYMIEHLLRNGESEFLIVENTMDTLYTYEDHVLQPVMLRTPTITSMKPKRFIVPCAFTDNYFIYRRLELEEDYDKDPFSFDSRRFPAYILDRKTKEIFKLELYDSNLSEERRLDDRVLTGFPGNSLFCSSTKKNQVVSHYNTSTLFKMQEENSLKGKLKDVVSKMQEGDNHIFVFYTFK